MPSWHLSCADPGCPRRCRRPGCRHPDFHGLSKLSRKDGGWLHWYDCTVSVARDPAPDGLAPPPSRRRKTPPAGPSPQQRRHEPAGVFSPPAADMSALLSSLALKEGLRAARAHKVVRWVAYLQIREASRLVGRGPIQVEQLNWPAVPIAASKGARLLQWSESTWRRAVLEAERLGWIERQVRSGRVRGNRRGYNPGSLYRVVWAMLPGGRPAADGGQPIIRMAAKSQGGSAWVRNGSRPTDGSGARPGRDGSSGGGRLGEPGWGAEKSDSGGLSLNGGAHLNSPPGKDPYSPRDKEPSQLRSQPSQMGADPSSEPSHAFQEPSQVSEYVKGPNLDPVRLKTGQTDAAQRADVPRAPTPPPYPPPQGGGPQPSGSLPTDELRAAIRSQPWYRDGKPRPR